VQQKLKNTIKHTLNAWVINFHIKKINYWNWNSVLFVLAAWFDQLYAHAQLFSRVDMTHEWRWFIPFCFLLSEWVSPSILDMSQSQTHHSPAIQLPAYQELTSMKEQAVINNNTGTWQTAYRFSRLSSQPSSLSRFSRIHRQRQAERTGNSACTNNWLLANSSTLRRWLVANHVANPTDQG